MSIKNEEIKKKIYKRHKVILIFFRNETFYKNLEFSIQNRIFLYKIEFLKFFLQNNIFQNFLLQNEIEKILLKKKKIKKFRKYFIQKNLLKQ